MKEKWINDLRDRLSDYEMDEPEGLWESLGVESYVPGSRLLRKGAVAAAVITLLIIGCGLIVWHNGVQNVQVTEKMAEVSFIPLIQKDGSAEGVIKNYTPSAEINPVDQIRYKEKSHGVTGPKEAIAIHSNEAIQSVLNEQEGLESVLETDTICSVFHESQYGGLFNGHNSDISKNHIPRNSRFALAVYASGIGNSSESQGRLAPNFSFPNGGPLYGDPMYSDPAPGQPEEALVKTQTNHHQPIKIGLTLQYNVSDRVGLEIGLMYTALTTDISLSKDNRASYGQRRMQYIGIPVNIKMSAWSWKFIDFYLSAGVMGEKCVSNRFEMQSVAEGLPLDGYSRQKDRPFQWSVNAGAGLQIRPMRNIGIFAEPGVSHYFNDGSSIETVYKERPWTFNLNVGIRWMLNP